MYLLIRYLFLLGRVNNGKITVVSHLDFFDLLKKSYILELNQLLCRFELDKKHRDENTTKNMSSA